MKQENKWKEIGKHDIISFDGNNGKSRFLLWLWQDNKHYYVIFCFIEKYKQKKYVQ